MALLRFRPPHDQVDSAPDTRRISSVGVEAFVVVMALATVGGLIAVGRDWSAPLVEVAPIDLSWRALPGYTLLTLARGMAAFFLSLVFTIVYATAAARSHRAERVLIPALDVLQSIPVLSFIPGFVIAFVALVPSRNLGLELACVLAIFTGQVWNMTFSYHASLRAIPTEQREVARLHRFGRWKTLTSLELPSGMIGLVWNSMMSMAGGWFFIPLIETTFVNGREFRVKGVGSYMRAAIEARDRPAMAGGIVAMVVMIVVLDQLLWRPLLVWAERFRNEETAGTEKPTSWAYDVIHGSRLVGWLRRRRRAAVRSAPAARPAPAAPTAAPGRGVPPALVRIAMAVVVAGVAWGTWRLVVLLGGVSFAGWIAVARGLGLTALRVLAAIAVGLAWTLPVGVAVGRSPRLSRALQPVIQVLAGFPAPMIYPLVALPLLTFGVNPSVVVVVLMLLGAQWYVLFNVAAGATSIPSDLREAAAAFRVVGMRRFVILYLAGVFPYLLTGVITAMGGAWNASVACELVELGRGHDPLVVDGIGSLIARAFGDERTPADYPLLAAATVALSLTLVLVNRFVWKPLHRIADDRFAMNR
jgi:NitT/TauT family transport system permease protein